uniref:Uncharacterized protein n=1 Tax=Arundo donax TaxID=35708 RepID=A0A0A9AXR0_ARUDO
MRSLHIYIIKEERFYFYSCNAYEHSNDYPVLIKIT